jgi:hypothetical protein
MILTAGSRQYEAGQVLTVSYEGREYDVEIVNATATEFTLRYRNEEDTRSIRGSR